jgi:hypothetical protein
MTKFEMSPEKFLEEYVYGQRGRISRNMAFGSQLADGLMDEEANGDPLLDLMASRLPKFERMDMPIEHPRGIEVEYARKDKKMAVKVPILADEDGSIPILAVPDTAKSDYSAFKEYKTSVRRWTQKMVDESGQVTFYTTAIWLATGAIPDDIELVNIETTYQDDGRLTVTGEMFRFPTKRTMADVIKMTRRMRHAWAGIKDLCEKELI